MQQLQITERSLSVTGPVLAGVGVLALAGAAVVPLMEFGPLSVQMLQHLVLMNILAPALALALPLTTLRISALAVPASCQLLLLWAWHTPFFQQLAASSALAQVGLMGLLGVAALWFWQGVIGAARWGNWSALAALLVTGKLACLLGALLIFAPRDLFSLPGLALALCTTGPSSLEDQQLAGLLMVTACPLSYLVVGVALAARMLSWLDGAQTRSHVAARSS
ncbi:MULTISPECIES: cytochrome c oxidase assembly protein [unclassified Chelatococcus]|uniref:cytochrome c oxidase assembly protein n=1 Tax=unclassified Chelatococcus TaxID=2638111 RepID=UPI001BD0AC42|nr:MULTISPECIES: cytochrome c oxidase assembly protein [unclassified Chelatococcus]MBS7699938.1 cytochrome c oxidase assembly protein [Chelatococcus sp. YT9]MBX3558637.1 cytochrome c oxidase assembly protein [Chelatococcus sp.]